MELASISRPNPNAAANPLVPGRDGYPAVIQVVEPLPPKPSPQLSNLSPLDSEFPVLVIVRLKFRYYLYFFIIYF